MSIRVFPLISVLLLILLSGSELAAQSASNAPASAASARPPFGDPSLPLEQRVNDLVSRMTLEEKVSQMQDIAPAIPRLGTENGVRRIVPGPVDGASTKFSITSAATLGD